MAPVFLPYPDIMTGGNVFTVQSIGPLQHGRPLDMRITEHTGIRRPARQVFVHKVLDHRPSKFITNIQHIMGEPMVYCRLSRVIEGIQVTATGLLFPSPRMS